MLLKQEEKNRQEEVEKMYADLWATDRIAKSEREEQEEKNSIERNRECLKVSILAKKLRFDLTLTG
jgi:hypothetical protein